MLILGRRIGERILIGDNIIVELVGLTRHNARIGVMAPDDVRIDREEIRPLRQSVPTDKNDPPDSSSINC